MIRAAHGRRIHFKLMIVTIRSLLFNGGGGGGWIEGRSYNVEPVNDGDNQWTAAAKLRWQGSRQADKNVCK